MRVGRTEFDITPVMLDRPFAYSRRDNQVVTFGETVSARFHRAALKLGIQPTDKPRRITLPSKLRFNELQAIAVTRLEKMPQDLLIVAGQSEVTAEQILDRARQGDSWTIRMHTSDLLEQERAARTGRVRLVEDVPPPTTEFLF